MTNHCHPLLINEGTASNTCEYCGEVKAPLSGGCCEECNWKMHTNELFESAASEELEEQKEKEKESKFTLENPYLSENFTEYEVLFQFWNKEHINDRNK